MDLHTAQQVLKEALDVLDQKEQHLAAIHVANAIHLLATSAQSKYPTEALPRLISVK